MSTPILTAICTGQPKPFRGDETSAIDKHPVEGRVAIGRLGVLCFVLGGKARGGRCGGGSQASWRARNGGASIPARSLSDVA